jgi:TonB family protein
MITLLLPGLASAEEPASPEPPPADAPAPAEPPVVDEPADAPPDAPQADPPRERPTMGFVPPELVFLPEVAYPEGQDGAEHKVELMLVLGVDGVVVEATVVTGAPPFDALALEAIRRARFLPALDDGAAIEVEVPFTWSFAPPPVNLAGQLRALGTDAPLAGVEVQVGDTVVVTDGDGRFALAGLPAGEVVVRVRDPRWVVGEVPVTVVAGERVDLELRAVPFSSGENEAVAVYRASPDVIVRRTIDERAVREAPGTMGDPVRALQNQPSVLRTPLEAGWVLVRGGDLDDTAVFLEGVQIPLLYHLGGFTSVLHPAMVDTVTLYPNAYPARIGQGTAGAVEVDPRPVGPDPRGDVGVNIVYTSVYAEAGFEGDGGVALAARRSYLDGVLALVLDPERASIAPRFWDWQGRLDTPRFSMSFLGMSDAIDTPTGNGDETVTVNQSMGLLATRVTLGDVSGDRWRVDVRPWVSTRGHDIVTLVLDEDERLRQLGLRVDAAGPVADRARVQAGVESWTGDYRVGRDATAAEGNVGLVAPYAQVETGDVVALSAGTRVDLYTVQDQYLRAGHSPRGTVRWQASKRVAFVGEAGQYHQLASYRWIVGLPTGPYQPLERSWGPSGGVRWTGAEVAVDADLWWRRSEGVASLEPDGTPSSGQSRAWGLETQVQWAPSELFDGSIIYQHSSSDARASEEVPWAPYRYDQPERLMMLGSFHLAKSWTLAGRFRYSSGYPLADGVESAFDVLTQQEFFFPLDDDRLAAFHSLDIKASKRWIGRRVTLDAYLDVQNVYSRRVAEPAINGLDDSDPVYGFGLPILPIFGINAAVR